MSSDYPEVLDMNADHYLVEWRSARSAPQMFAIEVTEVRTYEDKEDGWVVFRYLHGDHKDCISGAPKGRVITAAEAPAYAQKFQGVKSSLLKASDLQSGVTGVKKNLLADLAQPEREI